MIRDNYHSDHSLASIRIISCCYSYGFLFHYRYIQSKIEVNDLLTREEKKKTRQLCFFFMSSEASSVKRAAKRNTNTPTCQCVEHHCQLILLVIIIRYMFTCAQHSMSPNV